MTNIAIEHGLFIVDLPIKDGDFPVRYVNLYHVGYLPDVKSHWIPRCEMLSCLKRAVDLRSSTDMYTSVGSTSVNVASGND